MAEIYYMVLEMPQCSLKKFLTCSLLAFGMSVSKWGRGGREITKEGIFSCDMEYVCSVGHSGISYQQAEPQYHLSFFGLLCPMNNTDLTGSSFCPPCFLLLS